MPLHSPPHRRQTGHDRVTAWAVIAALAAGLAAAPGTATAQPTCRTDELGITVCTAPPRPRPRPRPLFDDGTRGLDQVQPAPRAGERAPEIIPGWRTNSFGRTLFGPGEAQPGGRCRTDTLGNTRCR